MEPVSYFKITDEAATLQGRVQSAPPEGAVTSSKIVNSKKTCVNYITCLELHVLYIYSCC